MERKKRSKGSVWEFCYANKIFGMFGFEMRACGQKLVKFCTLTHTHTRTHARTHTHTTAAKLVGRIMTITWHVKRSEQYYVLESVIHKNFFFNLSRQINTRPHFVLPVHKTDGRVSAFGIHACLKVSKMGRLNKR